jgi:hypothetical protein
MPFGTVCRTPAFVKKVSILVSAFVVALSATAVVSSQGNASTATRHGTASAAGYWLVTSGGVVSAHGGANEFGSLTGRVTNIGQVVAMAATGDAGGYWLVTTKGVVHPFGNAELHGSMAGTHLTRPIVGIAATPDGQGYWLVASDGGIFSFGDAHYYGSTGAMHLRSPIVGVAAAPQGDGYWLVARDGGVFSFGRVAFYGSTGSSRAGSPVVGMVATPDGKGYWLVTAAGKVSAFGDAENYGSAPSGMASPIVGMTTTLDGGGYWLAAKGGEVLNFGDAPSVRTKSPKRTSKQSVEAIAASNGSGYTAGGVSAVSTSDGGAQGTSSPGTSVATTIASTSGAPGLSPGVLPPVAIPTLPSTSPTTAIPAATSTVAAATTAASATTTSAAAATTAASATTTSAAAATTTSTTAGTTTSTTTPTTFTAAGESYEICTGPQSSTASLTSPWTYDALASGSESYTATQYEELNTDGTENSTVPGSAYNVTLPPLPSYLLNASGDVATVYAPGSGGIGATEDAAVLDFLEGGSYPNGWAAQMVSGDEVIGGSATGYPQPVIDEGNASTSDFDSGNSHYNSIMGHGVVATSMTSSTTVTAASAGFYAGYAVNQVTFADGTTATVNSISGDTLALAAAVTESAGTDFWLTSNSVNGYDDEFLGDAMAAANQGDTSLIVTTNTRTGLPYVPYEQLQIGGTLANGSAYSQLVTVKSVSGNTLTLLQPLAQAVPANAPVMYGQQAGDVTVEYMNIYNGPISNNPIINAIGDGWNVLHDYIHDTHPPAGQNAQGTGVAGGGSYETIDYDCFASLGEYSLNGGGTGTQFDYNEVMDTPANPDLSGNGDTGIGKWWGSLNNDLKDNAFVDDNGSVWFDNGNAGMLVEGNYFYDVPSRAVQNETGWGSEYVGNLFQDVGDGIYLNSSGGWDVPGSRYSDILIQGNYFDNVLSPVTIWQSSQRSCLNSGEAADAFGIQTGSDAYCSDGYPNNSSPSDAGPYASHYVDANLSPSGAYQVVANQTCSSSNPCGTSSNPIILTNPPVVDDWIGSAGATTTVQDSGTVPGTLDVASTAGFTSEGEIVFSSDTCDVYTYSSIVSATQLGGISNVGCPSNGDTATLNAGTTTVTEYPSFLTTTTDTTPVADFGGAGNGSVATLDVASTSGFPTSGQVMVGTTTMTAGGGVGAVLSYSGLGSSTVDCPSSSFTTGAASCLTGVSLVKDAQGNAQGSGSLTNGATVELVLPDHVSSVACTGGNCTNNAAVEVSPPVTSDLTAGQPFFNTGTCRYYVTTAATPSSPLDPAGKPYWDDCQWQTRDVSVTGNSFYLDAAEFNAAPYATGGTWGESGNACVTGPGGNCGQIIMGYQAPGNHPFDSNIESNAMMSISTSSSPLSNLNASGGPFVAGSSGVAANAEMPYNDVFSDNTYSGTWTFNAYNQASSCQAGWTGSALEYVAGGGNACSGLSFAQWQQYWGQDQGSTSS